MKAAVFFPGIGYHCDKPLLYYSRKLAQECLLQNGMRVPITLRNQKQLVQIWRNYDFAKLHQEAAERSLRP